MSIAKQCYHCGLELWFPANKKEQSMVNFNFAVAACDNFVVGEFSGKPIAFHRSEEEALLFRAAIQSDSCKYVILVWDHALETWFVKEEN